MPVRYSQFDIVKPLNQKMPISYLIIRSATDSLTRKPIPSQHYLSQIYECAWVATILIIVFIMMQCAKIMVVESGVV